MLSNLLYSINVILPIILLVLFGVILKRFGKLGDSFCETADWLVFKVGLPVMLFNEIIGCNFEKEFDAKMIAFIVISVTSAFVAVSLLAVAFIKDKAKRGAFVQGMCRSNFAILGVPLAVNMFGEAGGQAIAIATPFVILMFNAYSVILLSIFAGNDRHKLDLRTVLGILKNVVTNPLIIAVVLGLPFVFFHITLPTAATKTLSYLAGLATPLALLSLGANFKRENLKGRLGYSLVASIGKTVILPFIMVTIAVLVGLRGPALGVVLICFGSPTAVSSYIMAKKMDNDYDLAGQILLISTVLCSVTIFIFTFILKNLALI